MQTELKGKVTFLIKTFERPACLVRLIKSIREYYPDVCIIIVDDSKEHLQYEFDEHCTYVKIGYNSGLSAGRNYGISKIDTPYVLILDDDFVFTERTKIESMITVIEKGYFDLIGGEVWDYGVFNRYYAGTLKENSNILYHYLSGKNGRKSGFPKYNIILNFFLARTKDLIEVPWDDAIKIGCEHIEFFYRAKKEGFKITVNKKVKIDHFPESGIKYNDIKNNYAHYNDYLLKKHGFEDIKVLYPLKLKLIKHINSFILSIYKKLSSGLY